MAPFGVSPRSLRHALARLFAAAATAAVALLLTACGTVPGAREAGPLVLAGQGSYFVGGRELRSDALSAVPGFAPVGTVTVDQVYVRYEFFVRQGHAVHVIDQAARGRSAADPSAIVAVRGGRAPAEQLPAIFSAGREGAWEIFRFGPAHPQVHPGLQYPLEAQAELWKQMVPDLSRALPAPNPTVPALSQLAGRLDGAVLVAHSQSGPYPFQAAALDRRGLAAIVAIEPVACPKATDDMRPYRGLPILVLWGDYTAGSTFWAPRVQACQAFVAAANAAGAKAEAVMLAKHGMPGQSHMLMQDRNSLQLAQWLAQWIAAKAPR